MNRYILTSEDALRVLPPRGEAEPMLEVTCGRTMIFFELSQIESLCLVRGTLTESGKTEALRLIARDALLGAAHELYIPTNRADYPVFFAQLREFAPDLVLSPAADFVPESCDHTGKRHSH